MNWILSFVLVTSLVSVAVSKPQGDVTCNEGDTWMDDCNSCFCSNGLAACTQMACIQRPPQRQKRSAQECDCNPFGSLRPICDEQGRCECRSGYGGLKCDRCAPNYHQGPDGCQEECVPLTAWKKDFVVCTCSESGVETCEHELNRQRRDTETDLPSVTDVLADQVKKNMECEVGSVWKTNCADCECNDHGPHCKAIPDCKPGPISTPKKTCEHGERWMNECNQCWCDHGTAACTRKGCIGYPHFEVKLPEKQEQTVSKREVKTSCVEGERWMDECNQCWCDHGTAACTRKGCEAFQESEAQQQQQQQTVAKREVKESCVEGERWMDKCNQCWCDHGTATCTKIGCEAFQESEAQQQQQQQHTVAKREVKESCVEGEEWMVECNHCWCDNNRPACTRKGCLTVSHHHTVEKRDTTKQSCTPGKVWIQMTDNDEGCAKFTCQADGTATSVPHFTREMCPSYPKYINDDHQHVTKREAGCKPGDTWMNDCNKCTCNDEGKASCSRMQCEKDHPEEIPWLLEEQDQQQQQVSKRETSCTPGKVWIQMTDNDEGCAKFTCQADGVATSVPHFTREMCPSYPKYIEEQQQHVSKREAGEYLRSQRKRRTPPPAGCAPGQSYFDGCNTCTCMASGPPACTYKLCPPDAQIQTVNFAQLPAQSQQNIHY